MLTVFRGQSKTNEEERNPKKIKLSTPNEKAEFGIGLSVSDISDKYKDDALQESEKLLHLIFFMVV
ncbi:hypothetical protein SLEP1_g7323 [Rubroshorea leprosula]|uniref:Uncharacterized protein n=1 Tax=Rubroshorea leprosula TaxID=152421 RepID=A0AAV5I7W9_9ROSI|nr:hypothetical protein SLEP1_g7323 [Rubroshorea leprosula]